MKRLRLPKTTALLATLELVKFMLLLIMVIMFINLNAQVARQTEETRNISRTTGQLVRGQDEILRAIKQVTGDNALTAQEQTAIIICMLQTPLAQRTNDLQSACHKNPAGSGANDSAAQTSRSSFDISAFVSSLQPIVSKVRQLSNTSQAATKTAIAAGTPPEDLGWLQNANGNNLLKRLSRVQ